MKRCNPFVCGCCTMLLSGLALAASSSTNPGWRHGIVRDLASDYARVSVVAPHGDPGLIGQGAMQQFCTVQLGDTLYVGEREVAAGRGHSRFFAVNASNIAVQLKHGTMVVKDADGQRQTFRVLRTMPATPENMPDPTSFTARSLVE